MEAISFSDNFIDTVPTKSLQSNLIDRHNIQVGVGGCPKRQFCFVQLPLLTPARILRCYRSHHFPFTFIHCQSFVIRRSGFSFPVNIPDDVFVTLCDMSRKSPVSVVPSSRGNLEKTTRWLRNLGRTPDSSSASSPRALVGRD